MDEDDKHYADSKQAAKTQKFVQFSWRKPLVAEFLQVLHNIVTQIYNS